MTATLYTCRRCALPATHLGVFVDLERQGVNLGEPGYSREPLCLTHARERSYDACARVEPLAVLSLVVSVSLPEARRRALLLRGEMVPREIRRTFEISPLVPSWSVWVARVDFSKDPPCLEPMSYCAHEDPDYPIPDDPDEFVAILAAQLAEKGSPRVA